MQHETPDSCYVARWDEMSVCFLLLIETRIQEPYNCAYKEQRTTDCRQLVMHFSSKDWGKHCTTVCKLGNSHDVRDCRWFLRQVFLPKILLQLLRKVLSGNWSGFYTSMPSKHCLLPRLGWGRGHKWKCWSSQSASPLKWCYVTTCLFCSDVKL